MGHGLIGHIVYLIVVVIPGAVHTRCAMCRQMVKVKTKGTPLWGTRRLKELKRHRLRL